MSRRPNKEVEHTTTCYSTSPLVFCNRLSALQVYLLWNSHCASWTLIWFPAAFLFPYLMVTLVDMKEKRNLRMSCRTVASTSQLVCSSVELTKITQRRQCTRVNAKRFVLKIDCISGGWRLCQSHTGIHCRHLPTLYHFSNGRKLSN